MVVLMVSDGWAKIRQGDHTGWLDPSLLQFAAPANTMFVCFGKDVSEARNAQGQKVPHPRNGTAVSAGSSIDGWSIVSVPGLSQDIWIRSSALHTLNPPATFLKDGHRRGGTTAV